MISTKKYLHFYCYFTGFIIAVPQVIILTYYLSFLSTYSSFLCFVYGVWGKLKETTVETCNVFSLKSNWPITIFTFKKKKRRKEKRKRQLLCSSFIFFDKVNGLRWPLPSICNVVIGILMGYYQLVKWRPSIM